MVVAHHPFHFSHRPAQARLRDGGGGDNATGQGQQQQQQQQELPPHRTVFLLSAYNLGKERLLIGVSKRVGRPVVVDEKKMRVLQCLGLDAVRGGRGGGRGFTGEGVLAEKPTIDGSYDVIHTPYLSLPTTNKPTPNPTGGDGLLHARPGGLAPARVPDGLPGRDVVGGGHVLKLRLRVDDIHASLPPPPTPNALNIITK